MDKEKMKLQRVIITRRADNRFDVVREREENGETGGGVETLEDAFNYVRCIYDEKGEYIECSSNSKVIEEAFQEFEEKYDIDVDDAITIKHGDGDYREWSAYDFFEEGFKAARGLACRSK